ncbi:DUF6607 family protein [Pseudofulvibacter geojedonensis]|uniref:DUF6607 family protein n=1 Tax=Pseudofulvibacter geojedonensis TaxID=1123758 RepID=A0ABW3I258_9FLAO
MKQFSLLILILVSISLSAQNKKEQDHQAIKSMCGCYKVTFNFAETFNYSNDSLYKPSKMKSESAIEWVQLVEDNDNKVSMQHLLQVGRSDKPYIVKHWRQDWLFENTNFYMFNTGNNWAFEKKTPEQVKGQWTQKVYQVDDSPRYEGSATWVHVDGKSFWENTTPAPLPRREYTKRSDYNLTMRGNRHEIVGDNWIHDQDNDKILRETGKEDFILAKEKGYNTYEKLPDEKCKAAQEWWQKNINKWKLVRNKWTEVYGRNKDLSLEKKVDNKLLYKYLFSEYYETKRKIAKIIDAFVKDDSNDKAEK